jgi:leucyl aminopeptidase
MKILIESLSKKRVSADLLIAGFYENEKTPKALESLEPAFAKLVDGAVKKGRFEGKFGQVFSSYSNEYSEAPEIVVFGLGQKKNHKKTCFRKATGQILQLAKGRKASSVRILLDSFTNSEVKTADAVELLSEVSSLASYEFDRYKSKKEDAKKQKKIEVIEAVLEDAKNKNLQDRIRYAEAVAEGVLLARDLINEPGNIMTPEALAKAAEEMAEKKNLTCELISQGEMEQMKMGGILAVNKGSRYQAALIVLEHGARYKKNGTVCLVGKGVTFDTGGISIKPSADMEKMKYDMSGAAAVIGTMSVIADLKLPLHVVGLAPAVENNVAEDPQRPGDIIRMYNGKTVEVLNTDAEGRLILADALAYSAKYKPDAIIDLATLTGMCAYTFGDKAIGLMTTDDKLANKVKQAGEAVGERCWELPMFDEYAEQIKGHHSDLLNIGGRYGGTITAAKFLQEFVPEKTAWVHLDIAGTAWTDAPRYDCPKGATGVGVRLLVNFLSNY